MEDTGGTKTNGKTAVVVAVASVAASAFIWQWNKSRQEKDCPLHVSYEHPKMPQAVNIISSLPRFIRHPLVIGGASPEPPKDAVDLLGKGAAKGEKHDPYEKKELVRGLVWRVRYKHLVDDKLGKAMKEIFGLDLEDPDLMERGGEKMREKIKADMKHMADMKNIAESEADDEKAALARLKAGSVNTFDMLVARIGTEGKGGLLLYNPCRIHPEFVEWLNSLNVGPVKYIVSGSSAHTNQLKQASQAFPFAKVVCSSAAEKKCMSVGMRPADTLYTDPSALTALNETLSGTGISMHHVIGDVGSQALCVLAHRHLFEVDLIYGHFDMSRFATFERHVWENEQNAQVSGGRLFFYGMLAKGSSSPNGFLPVYRFMMMDPTSPLTKMSLDSPAADGSSCKKMAESLRKVLALDFDEADPVHSMLAKSMPADEFRKCIDAAWNWLDGESLLLKH